MAATESLGVPGFDYQVWCAHLAGTLDYILEHPDKEAAYVIAREVLKNYDAAIVRASAVQERRDNVIPLRGPVSINTIIDDLGFTR